MNYSFRGWTFRSQMRPSRNDAMATELNHPVCLCSALRHRRPLCAPLTPKLSRAVRRHRAECSF
eukprot:1155251-Pleurochrysis_carterae.AAC.1